MKKYRNSASHTSSRTLLVRIVALVCAGLIALSALSAIFFV